MGENKVASWPEKLEPDERRAIVSRAQTVWIHTVHSIAEHDRVLVHLLGGGLNGRELALPVTVSITECIYWPLLPVIVLGISGLWFGVSGCSLP